MSKLPRTDVVVPLPPPDRGRAGAQADPMAELLDRMAITRVVQDWGLFRDAGRWDALRALYTADGTMHATWFAGSADDFVARSREAAKRGARAQHFIGAATIDIDGDRAVAETRMILMVRGHVGAAEVDVTCYGRFHDLFIRQQGTWRIRSRVPIYEKDRLDALDGTPVDLDPARLGSYPEGYRHLAYLQSLGGATLTPGLPTPGSAALEALYATGARWLART